MENYPYSQFSQPITETVYPDSEDTTISASQFPDPLLLHRNLLLCSRTLPRYQGQLHYWTWKEGHQPRGL